MNYINWANYEWLTQERWGNIHPSKTFNWYDPSAVEIKDETLILKTHHNPKEFIIDNKKIISNTGVGLVSNTTKFQYGYFEIEAKLPKGKNLWPAFWMWGFESWPPEIDIIEGYSSTKYPSYFKINLNSIMGFWNIKTNIHFKENNHNKSIDEKTHYFGFKNPQNNFIKYGCSWEKNKIVFYYNNKIVRTVEDENILNKLSNTYMNVIINNSIRYDNKIDKNHYSEFIIKNFIYEKY